MLNQNLHLTFQWLNKNSETPEETKLYVTDISIPAVWKSTEVGFYEYIYVVVFNGDISQNIRVYLGNIMVNSD